MPAVPTDSQGRPLADWWQRLVAIIIDGILLAIPKIIIAAIVLSAADRRNSLVTTGSFVAGAIILDIIFTVIDLGYFALLNGSERGQTVGQMALGITVRDEASGGPLGTQRAGLRILALAPGIIIGWVPILGIVASLYTLVAAFSPLWDAGVRGSTTRHSTPWSSRSADQVGIR